MKAKVFVVEDEAAIRELYTYALDGAGFAVACFATGEAFFETLGQQMPDIILLDIMLEGADGFEILQQLKADRTTAHIPVIMVSAKGEELSKVKGLNLGADDYIAKPFGVLELVARIQANLRKHGQSKQDDLCYGDISIQQARREVWVAGNLIATTPKEYNLLRLLCQSPEQVLGREDIFAAVWGSDFVGETRTLDMHIKELRKKLAAAGSLCEIQTLRSVGYMLSRP